MGTDRPGGEWGGEWMVMMTRKAYEVFLPYLSTNKTINVLCCVWGDSAPSIGRLQDGFVASTAYRYTSSPAIYDEYLCFAKSTFWINHGFCKSFVNRHSIFENWWLFCFFFEISCIFKCFSLFLRFSIAISKKFRKNFSIILIEFVFFVEIFDLSIDHFYYNERFVIEIIDLQFTNVIYENLHISKICMWIFGFFYFIQCDKWKFEFVFHII